MKLTTENLNCEILRLEELGKHYDRFGDEASAIYARGQALVLRKIRGGEYSF
jgi:hypothetical protein